MLTSTIQPGQFMVGTKIFKAGDAIALTEEEQKEMEAIGAIFDEWTTLRTELLGAVVQTDEPFDLEIAAKAHEMKIKNFHLRYRLNILIAEVEKRFGGLLPIFFSSTKKQLFISAKAEESLVYTTKFVGDTIGLPAFAFPLFIAKGLVCGKEQIVFDNTKDEAVSAISVFGKVKESEMEAWKSMARLETFCAHLEKALTDDGPQAMSLVVLWNDDEVRVINADAIPSTVDPNTRVLWNLDKVLKEYPAKAITLAVEKAEPQKITFLISHIDKGEKPRGATLTHTIAPVRETEIDYEAAPNFAITRKTPEDIDALLAE